ncbi:hypothetical protein ACFW9X_35920 [Streptomyces sp. NPDC059466]|uniref:hypothetical protein n=1 Tax=Streptomyces sp. NPDC059466 TaxID=3346843 RepID=UPI0036BE142A
MPQPIMRVLGWLRGQPQATRVVIAVGLPVGFALIGLGLWLDYVNWWPTHGYALNLISGLTGACYGVPFALVGLDYLSRNQAAYRETVETRVRAAAAVDSFVTSLLDVSNGRSLDEVTNLVHDLSTQVGNIRLLRDGDPARDAAERAFLTDFDRLMPSPHGRPRERWGAFTIRSDDIKKFRLWRTDVKYRWRKLDGMLGQKDGGWIDKATETAGHQAAELLMLDGRNPWRLRSRDGQSGVESMRNFLEDLAGLCEAATALVAATR